MRIAVTGGSGFIGNRLVGALLERGHRVVSIDLIPKGVRAGMEFRSSDVTNFETTREAIEGVEAVYHLAGFVLDGVQADPYRGFIVNALGTLNVLEACRLNGIGRFLFASSFKVYEGIWDAPEIDETVCLNPGGMSLFGMSKLAGESAAWEYSRRHGLSVTVLRFGSAYGPGPSSNAVGTFVKAAQAGETIEVWGDGARVSQYTHVDDIAAGLVLALDYPDLTFNLVSPEATSVRQLLALIEKHLRIVVSFRKDKKEGPSHPFISSRRAEEMLGWRSLPLQLGLKSCIDTAGIPSMQDSWRRPGGL